MSGRAYGEGDWFAVPVSDTDYVPGVIARANPEGIMFGYFFCVRYPDVPSVSDVLGFRAQHAAMVANFSHLALKRKKWPLIGASSKWNRDEWPMVPFYRTESLTGRTFRVTYSDDDPGVVFGEELLPRGSVSSGPDDVLMGPRSVERSLSRICSGCK